MVLAWLWQDDGLVLMGTWCKKLETLRLNVASQGLTGRGVTAALLGCGRSLRELELQRCSGVGREALKAIAEYCPRLEALSLKACPLVSDQGLLHFRNARCAATEASLGPECPSLSAASQRELGCTCSMCQLFTASSLPLRISCTRFIRRL